VVGGKKCVWGVVDEGEFAYFFFFFFFVSGYIKINNEELFIYVFFLLDICAFYRNAGIDLL
jgi:hypothetical protein